MHQTEEQLTAVLRRFPQLRTIYNNCIGCKYRVGIWVELIGGTAVKETPYCQQTIYIYIKGKFMRKTKENTYSIYLPF